MTEEKSWLILSEISSLVFKSEAYLNPKNLSPNQGPNFILLLYKALVPELDERSLGY